MNILFYETRDAHAHSFACMTRTYSIICLHLDDRAIHCRLP